MTRQDTIVEMHHETDLLREAGCQLPMFPCEDIIPVTSLSLGHKFCLSTVLPLRDQLSNHMNPGGPFKIQTVTMTII